MPLGLNNTSIIKSEFLEKTLFMYVAYSRPNGWTEWAYNFCGHSWEAGGCYRLKRDYLKKIYLNPQIFVIVS